MRAESVSFELASEERFERLAAFVRALAQAKSEDDFRDDAYWEAFLDERTRAAFWWPTPAEAEDWRRRWFATPIERRWTAPDLQTPWTFGSLIYAVANGEFGQLACRRTNGGGGGGGGGVVELEPHAWPFGGTAWIHAAIEAFGGRVVDDTAV